MAKEDNGSLANDFGVQDVSWRRFEDIPSDFEKFREREKNLERNLDELGAIRKITANSADNDHR